MQENDRVAIADGNKTHLAVTHPHPTPGVRVFGGNLVRHDIAPLAIGGGAGTRRLGAVVGNGSLFGMVPAPLQAQWPGHARMSKGNRRELGVFADGALFQWISKYLLTSVNCFNSY
jgi:hypothetical protein